MIINKKNKELDAQRQVFGEFINDFDNTCVKKETFHKFILRIIFSNKNCMLKHHYYMLNLHYYCEDIIINFLC